MSVNDKDGTIAVNRLGAGFGTAEDMLNILKHEGAHGTYADADVDERAASAVWDGSANAPRNSYVPIEKREMFARNTDKWVTDRMNGDARDEKIVVSGGVYKLQKKEDGLYYYEFIDTALVKINTYKDDIKKSENKNEKITWLVFDNGWTEDDKRRLNEVAKEKGVELIIFNNTDTLFTYINEKFMTKDERGIDKITDMSVFSHGSTKKFGTIMLDYDYVTIESVMKIDNKNIDSIKGESFAPNSTVYIYACNIGTARENSTAQSLANITNGKVIAYDGKTDYTNIYPKWDWEHTDLERIIGKGIDYTVDYMWNNRYQDYVKEQILTGKPIMAYKDFIEPYRSKFNKAKGMTLPIPGYKNDSTVRTEEIVFTKK
jgi:hypothetical protein